MLQEKLKNYRLVLASASPRRQQLLKEMRIDFEIRLKPVQEVYPKELKGSQISDYLSQLKASVFKKSLSPNEILITSDTVVWHKNSSLAKAIDAEEARAMLKILSGDWHEVITSVCFTTTGWQKTVNQSTRVKFNRLSDDEINFYINTFEPFDKAGAYGIQEWIGLVGVEKIEGSYTNVMGFPTAVFYKTLLEMVK